MIAAMKKRVSVIVSPLNGLVPQFLCPSPTVFQYKSEKRSHPAKLQGLCPLSYGHFDTFLELKHDHQMRQWILSSPSKFWRIWLSLLGLALLLIVVCYFFVDQRFALFFGAPEQVKVWLFHRHITEIGNAEPYIVLALLGLLWKKVRKYSAYWLACLLFSGLALHILKFLVGRERPHMTPEHNPSIFEFFSIHHHYQSFPSGHSQTLFSTATFIAFLFPKTFPWVFALALYLASTRAIVLAHFTSDVWAGAFLGLLVSAITLRRLVQRYGP